MASRNHENAVPSQELIEQFCSVTGAERNVAVSMLAACNNNVELAIGMQMDSVNSSATTQPTAQPSTSTMETQVRAPIPQVQEQLVEDSHHYGFRGRRRGARVVSVFDGMRNFEAEMRHDQSRRDGAAASSAASKKRKTLEELFRPPIDLMHKGSFKTAKDAGASANKWLMVNVQNSKEFPCQVLNRDIWSNQAVKSLVKEHFVFWQVYHDSEEGRQYMQFYSINEWPYVAILDPLTGENMAVWHKLDCNSFCELVTAFLSVHPSLDGTCSPPKKKRREDVNNIIDESEDAQFQEALKKSMEETKSRSVPILPELTDDESGDDDLETFSDSEAEDKAGANSPVKKSKNTSSTINSRDTVSSNGAKAADSGDNVTDTVNCSKAKLKNSNAAQTISKETSNSEESKSCSPKQKAKWKEHLGKSDDPESKIQIRFPDGKKEQLCIPASSKLMALVQYVIEAGFSNEHFELVTNYPKRKLSYLDFEATLQSVGLFPQETVFVQER